MELLNREHDKMKNTETKDIYLIAVLSKKFDEKYLKMYPVLKGHCIPTGRGFFLLHFSTDILSLTGPKNESS
jgi:hypothetical protein